ncbi:MAG: hypothetical protein OEX19_15685, partial [Gammaproteobacteria bacterium]|nr:hypothetical protein [Gammaproteobacteria bacterium]
MSSLPPERCDAGLKSYFILNIFLPGRVCLPIFPVNINSYRYYFIGLCGVFLSSGNPGILLPVAPTN